MDPGTAGTLLLEKRHRERLGDVLRQPHRTPGWQFNWLKFSLEKPLEFWLEFPLDSTEEKGPF